MTTASHSGYRYQVGGALPPHSPSYVQRRADALLYAKLKAGEFCYALGAPQTGKSSLRVRTARRLKAEGIACVEINLSQIGTQAIAIESWYAGLIDAITTSLPQIYRNFNLRQWWIHQGLLPPVQRLSKFIDSVLLPLTPQPKIVILIDEIESIFNLNFNTEDFFAALSASYEKRATNPQYNRLAFALFGTAIVANLGADSSRNPFKIATAIPLDGFSLELAKPLGVGLTKKFKKPKAAVRAILAWTGGQPFLTQKVCHLVQNIPVPIPAGKEAAIVAGSSSTPAGAAAGQGAAKAKD